MIAYRWQRACGCGPWRPDCAAVHPLSFRGHEAFTYNHLNAASHDAFVSGTHRCAADVVSVGQLLFGDLVPAAYEEGVFALHRIVVPYAVTSPEGQVFYRPEAVLSDTRLSVDQAVTLVTQVSPSAYR